MKVNHKVALEQCWVRRRRQGRGPVYRILDRLARRSVAIAPADVSAGHLAARNLCNVYNAIKPGTRRWRFDPGILNSGGQPRNVLGARRTRLHRAHMLLFGKLTLQFGLALGLRFEIRSMLGIIGLLGVRGALCIIGAFGILSPLRVLGALGFLGTLRGGDGHVQMLQPADVEFQAGRRWTSPRTRIAYPVQWRVRAGNREFNLEPLLDDQENDTRLSTGAIYWEGAVRAYEQGRLVGRGYLELTGYGERLRLR